MFLYRNSVRKMMGSPAEEIYPNFAAADDPKGSGTFFSAHGLAMSLALGRCRGRFTSPRYSDNSCSLGQLLEKNDVEKRTLKLSVNPDLFSRKKKHYYFSGTLVENVENMGNS